MGPEDDTDDGPPHDEPCDGCGGAAVVRVVLGSGKALVFCDDCWSRNEAALRRAAATVRG